jgi:4-hydroxybenzoate polyprenyltransferase
MVSPLHHLADRSQTNDIEELYVDYEGTPYLTGLAQASAAIGVFIGTVALLALLGSLHRGFHYYWWIVLILVVDIGLNMAVRVARARKRRRLGLSRAVRLWRNGVGPRPYS